jgi:hypothetical protein
MFKSSRDSIAEKRRSVKISPLFLPFPPPWPSADGRKGAWEGGVGADAALPRALLREIFGFTEDFPHLPLAKSHGMCYNELLKN